ncbi:uncharacterized protein [Rutidosis leptorrhynchoides]|uniref:uncharacterized protein n=1 Tax=Rutidosis leptorrhynchoides TaxID=125765 RepID=UPI003A990C6E
MVEDTADSSNPRPSTNAKLFDKSVRATPIDENYKHEGKGIDGVNDYNDKHTDGDVGPHVEASPKSASASSRIRSAKSISRKGVQVDGDDKFNCKGCGKHSKPKRCTSRSKIADTERSKSSGSYINRTELKDFGEQIGLRWPNPAPNPQWPSIISLNVRGFGVDGKFDWVKGICLCEGPDVLALQEMKSGHISDRWVYSLWGNNEFGYVQKEVVGNSGGLLLIWDTKRFNVNNAVGNEFFLAIRGNWVGFEKESFIVNVRDQSDKLNYVFNQRRADWFNEFISTNNLIEVVISGRKFTRISDDGLKFSKLDRFLVTEEFSKLWEDLSVIPLERRGSNHYPIILRDWVIDFGPKPFKVFDEWLSKEGVDEVIRKAWNSQFGSLDEELAKLKFEADEWERKAESTTLSDSDRSTWLDVRRKWLEKERVKTNMLKQKARIQQLVGHCSTAGLFTSVGSAAVGFNANSLTTTESESLEGMFLEDEVWEAVKNCGSTKALGPDGFNMRFFKQNWETVKDDIMLAVQSFWNTSEISKGCNASFITLVPKKLDLMSLNDYRPISLIGSLYKIIAKLLSNRLRKVVPNLVGFEQSNFIKGINILDGALIANETLGGVRQGDLLSPFLFIIVTEALNVLIKAAVSCNLYSGVEVGGDKILISHLQYANDTIFFGSWELENMWNLIKLLECFELTSGLKVNYHKSNLFEVAVDSAEINDMARLLGCKVGEFPFTYLGLPVGAKMNKISNWSPVLDKVGKRLADWKARAMSFGGRLTLVKSVLNSLPLYYFSLFGVPPCVLKKLESVRCSFFWGGSGNDLKMAWLELNGNASVRDRLGLSNSGNKRNWAWRRDPTGRAAGEFATFSDLISSVSTVDGTTDSWRWTYNTCGLFSTQVLTGQINSKILQAGTSVFETERNNLVPSKLEVFVWRSRKRFIPVLTELDKRGIDLNSVRNPYNIVGIHFDKIDADLMYQGQRLGTKELPMFYLLPKNEKSFVNVLLRGEHVLQLINGDEKMVYESENKSGVYTIGVKVRIVMRTKVMMVNWSTVQSVIMIDNLQVSIGDHHEFLSAI